MLNLPRRYKELVEMPSEIEEIIYSDDGERYISEVRRYSSFLFHVPFRKLHFAENSVLCSYQILVYQHVNMSNVLYTVSFAHRKNFN